MSFNSLLRALSETFADGQGPVTDVSTLRGIVRQAWSWLSGESTSEVLHSGIEWMRPRLVEAGQATQADLNALTNLDPLLRVPLEGTARAFQSAEEILEKLQEAVARGDAVDCQRCLGKLEQTAQRLRQHEQAVAQWASAPVPRCPRCGVDGGEHQRRCSSCSLALLYPDTRPGSSRPQYAAVLGPEFVAVYRAYVGVVTGRSSLDHLMSTLNPLESTLGTIRTLAARAEDPDGVTAAIGDTMAAALEGTALMRSVLTTRSMADLNDGWEKVLLCGLRLQGERAELLGESPTQFQDSVTLTGEF